MATRVFSDARTAADLVFVSGQTPLHEDGAVDTEIDKQTHLVLDKIDQILRAQELTMDDVVKVTYFLTDITELPAVREALLKRWNDPSPSASLVEVSALIDPRFRVEIEAVAVRTMNPAPAA